MNLEIVRKRRQILVEGCSVEEIPMLDDDTIRPLAGFLPAPFGSAPVKFASFTSR